MFSPPHDVQQAIQQAVCILSKGELGDITSHELRVQLDYLMPWLCPAEESQPPASTGGDAGAPPAQQSGQHASKHPKRRPFHLGK